MILISNPRKYLKLFFALVVLTIFGFFFQNCSNRFQATSDSEKKDSSTLDSNRIVFCPTPEQAETELSRTCFYNFIRRLEAGEEFDNFFEFEPQFPLYKDGSDRRSWIYLPEGKKINTSNIDNWTYPKGTILYRQSFIAGVLIETQQSEKISDDVGFQSWRYTTYANLANDTDGKAINDSFNSQTVDEMAKYSVYDFRNQYIINTPNSCVSCHGSTVDGVRGFNYLQLSSNQIMFNLDSAKRLGWFSQNPAVFDQIPGNELDKSVIGYIQSNCVTCHDGIGTGRGNFRHLSTNTTLSDENIIKHGSANPGFITPRSPNRSLLYEKFRTGEMPKVPHKTIHHNMISRIADWIYSIDLPELVPPMSPTYTSIKSVIISQRCNGCHNDQSTPAGVNLANYASIIASGILISGDPNGSRIIKALERPGDDYMPRAGNPRQRLTPYEIGIIRQWILDGALNN